MVDLTQTRQQASYRELFRCNLAPGLLNEIRKAANSYFILENDCFKEKISKTPGRRVKPEKAG